VCSSEIVRPLRIPILIGYYRRVDFSSPSFGSVGVITHPLDDDVRGFYAKWGFQDPSFDPRRAMLVRMVDLRRSFET
jgi:hypothetical protein